MFEIRVLRNSVVNMKKKLRKQELLTQFCV